MNVSAPFLPQDLEALDELLGRAYLVGPMEWIFDKHQGDPRMIGMRHDCDNVIHPAVRLAEWEEARVHRSTYYVLHTSPYWDNKPLLREALEKIAGCGHEIGIHNDAITAALQTGREPKAILHEAIDELRSYGHEIRSTVAHGHQLCHIARYVNDEMFDTCARATHGSPRRALEHRGRVLVLAPVSLSEFGLDFDANWLPRGDYLSDSGGKWSQPFDEVAAAFPSRGQLHILQHPDWWGEALERAQVAA